MKHFHEVITALALWTPPDELAEVTFKVHLVSHEIEIEMRVCCWGESGVLRESTLPEHVHAVLDALAKSTLKHLAELRRPDPLDPRVAGILDRCRETFREHTNHRDRLPNPYARNPRPASA